GETLGTSGVTGSPSLTTTATPTSPISGSPYTITAALGALTSGNYSFIFVNGQLTIAPRPVTVKATNISRVYGDATPASAISLSVGTLAGGDTLATLGTPSFTTSPTNPAVNVGHYTITVSGLSNTNYTITYDNTGTLDITPRPVTAKATNISRVYGDVTPAFAIGLSVGTLAGGDTLATLGTPAFATSPTNPAVNVGHYTITVSGLSNA